MAFRLLTRDVELLARVAEYRLMTAPQVAHLQGFSGLQVTRRRLAQLEETGLIESYRRGCGRKRGRPEKIFTVASPGAELLRSRGVLEPWTQNERVNGSAMHCPDHQLLMNWFRLHLDHFGTHHPALVTRFLSSTSPSLPLRADRTALVREHFRMNGKKPRTICFVPDAVFCVARQDGEHGLLFFLEVDMGTEPVVSSRESRQRDVRQKILNYGALLRSERHRRYERVFGLPFRGFRVLLLTNTERRRRTVEDLVWEIGGHDFVWTLDPNQLFAHGIAAPVWTRGGDRKRGPQSLFGDDYCGAWPLPTLGR